MRFPFVARVLFVLTTVVLSPVALQAATTYVDDDCTLENQQGSQEFPYCTIQAGLDARWLTVVVAEGTYTGPGNRDLDFGGRNLKLSSADGPEVTIIDCGWAGRGFIFENGEPATARVEGFTIRHCRPSDGEGGGGMLIQSESRPMIINCTFEDNLAVGTGSNVFGGGLLIGDGTLDLMCRPIIENCRFVGNRIEAGPGQVAYGGGLAVNAPGGVRIKSCTFIGNVAAEGPESESGGRGGAIWSGGRPEITDCDFIDNEASGTMEHTGHAGAAYLGGTPVLRNCRFIGNRASAPIEGGGSGGAVLLSSTQAFFYDCEFRDNEATAVGGAAWTDSRPTFIRSLFSNNRAAVGGAIFSVTGTPTVQRCTFLGNMATDPDDPLGGGAIANVGFNWSSTRPQFIESIFSGNSSSTYGGAISNGDQSDPIVTGSTFVNNSALISGGAIYTTDDIGAHTTTIVTNSILHGNTPDQIVDINGATTTVSHSIVQGGWAGTVIIDADPQFSDADGPDDVPGTLDDNVRLRPGSPGIDMGDNAEVPELLTTGGDCCETHDSPGCSDPACEAIVCGIEPSCCEESTEYWDWPGLCSFNLAQAEPVCLAGCKGPPVDHDGQWRFVDDPDTADGGADEPPMVDIGALERPHGNLLTFESDKATLGWPEMGSAEAYNVYRGSLSDLVDSDQDGLPDSGYGSCVYSGDGDPPFADWEPVNPATGFFYVMSLTDDVGLEIALGSTSAGHPRWVAAPCP